MVNHLKITSQHLKKEDKRRDNVTEMTKGEDCKLCLQTWEENSYKWEK